MLFLICISFRLGKSDGESHSPNHEISFHNRGGGGGESGRGMVSNGGGGGRQYEEEEGEDFDELDRDTSHSNFGQQQLQENSSSSSSLQGSTFLVMILARFAVLQL